MTFFRLARQLSTNLRDPNNFLFLPWLQLKPSAFRPPENLIAQFVPRRRCFLGNWNDRARSKNNKNSIKTVLSELLRAALKVTWSEWRDSNPRPLVPQTSALTGLRYTPTLCLIVMPHACGNQRLLILASSPKAFCIPQSQSGLRAARRVEGR